MGGLREPQFDFVTFDTSALSDLFVSQSQVCLGFQTGKNIKISPLSPKINSLFEATCKMIKDAHCLFLWAPPGSSARAGERCSIGGPTGSGRSYPQSISGPST